MKVITKITEYTKVDFSQYSNGGFKQTKGFLNAESTLVVIPFIDLLWTSPERLRLRVLPSFGHYQQSDIYSLAIVMHELFERTGPFGVETIQIQPYGEYVNKPTV